ncbi:MAG: hypothetical protein AAB699_01805 [Patescibacteria group bacterium]
MNRKILVIFVIITAVVVGAVIFFRGGLEEPGSPRDSAGLVIGANAIYVEEQAPSRTLAVAVVRLEKPGFVLVHEDTSGAPGGILGRSALLPAGETNNLATISLSRLTRDGETLYVMIHLDDGDGVFDAVKDKPALDSVGALPVMMSITVSAEATEPGAVSL